VQSTEEDRLIGAAQRGDARAFEELVRRYDRDVLRLALRIVRSEEEARDLYQETFLRLFQTLDRFRHECSFQTWLYRVVTNLCLDHLRRAAARPERPAAAPAGEEAGDDPLALMPEERPDSDPERALLGREIGRRIEAALHRLNPRERLVFEMRHHQGLRTRAIAEALDTSEETVRNSLCRAHRELRVALEDLGRTGHRVVESIDPARAES
jgi:RNA polymerase sigma-70 factor (ECF subfamily)